MKQLPMARCNNVDTHTHMHNQFISIASVPVIAISSTHYYFLVRAVVAVQ